MANPDETVNAKDTTDIWFATYLRYKGHKLLDYEVIRPGKSRFIIEITPDEWKERKIEFLRHEISKLKQIMEELKDLSY